MYYEIFDTVKIDFSDGKKIIYPQEEQLVALPSDNFYYNSKENKYYVERNGVIMHEFNSKIESTYVYKNLGDSTFLKDTNTYDFNSYKVIKEKRKEYTYLYTITENDYLKAKW